MKRKDTLNLIVIAALMIIALIHSFKDEYDAATYYMVFAIGLTYVTLESKKTTS